MRLCGHVMVTSPTGKGVIVMGGSTAPDKYSTNLQQCLNCHNQWSGQDWNKLCKLDITILLLFQFQMSWSLNKSEMTFSYPESKTF